MAQSKPASGLPHLPLANEQMILARTIRFGARLSAFLRDESGQSVTEYAVVMAVITLIALVGISVTGVQALDIFRRTASSLH